ncbi:MAG: hypothetical protein JWQ49_4116, partial [Edaphobacter sp.]|nr:hypothetical protein [Edaphobacter sp.]
CNDSLVLGLFASAFRQMEAPSPERGVLSSWSEDMVGTLDQQTAQVDVACPRDPELRISLARLAASWSQAV